jgi:hypothetical protein
VVPGPVPGAGPAVGVLGRAQGQRPELNLAPDELSAPGSERGNGASGEESCATRTTAPSPEAILELARREEEHKRRGRLRIFIGHGPRVVGKT